MAKIDVLIPTFNRAALLPESINSILAQTEQDFRIVIYDDGSTEDYDLPNDSRIEFHRGEKNKGVAYARNQLLKHVNAPFACWQDSDDVSCQRRLEVMIGMLENKRVDVGLSYLYFFRGAVSRQHWSIYRVDTTRYDPQVDRCGVVNNLTFATCVFRGHLKKYEFNVSKVIAEDYEWIRTIVASGHKFATRHEGLYFARRHEGRLTHIVGERRKRAAKRAARKKAEQEIREKRERKERQEMRKRKEAKDCKERKERKVCKERKGG